MTPKVSVLTPTIPGREWFLDRCQRSVRSQTYQGEVEHVVVRGAPTAAEGFQKALEEATGAYVMPVSDDDWIAPHALEALVAVLEDGNELAFATTLVVSPGNHRLTGVGGAVMWRREVTDRLGGFDPSFPLAADTELYGRMLDAGVETGFRDEPLYFQTEHPGHGSFVHADALAKELQAISLRRSSRPVGAA